jgi:twitching motility protein PilT
MTTEQTNDSRINPAAEPELNKFFRAAIKTQANGLHLKAGQSPKLRIHGQLKDTTGETITQEKLERIIFEVLTPEQKETFQKEGGLDFVYEIGEESRFRVNIFRQRGMISLVARRVNTNVPPLDSLHLPPILKRIASNNQGIILITGPSGSGKTTTIASMIDYISNTRSCHIVTIENPIEYLFKDKKAIISQREIGIDVRDFDEALRDLARQDPDVVMVGEMRDIKTVLAALRAAEGGRLVLGTMYASNSTQAIQRLLDLFPQAERELVRQTLSLTMKAIIAQVLLPCIKEGIDRIPAVEILLVNSAVKKLIAEGREIDMLSVIRSSQEEGMQDITYHLCELVKNGSVDTKEAYRCAPNVDELRMAIKGIKADTTGIL